MEKKLISFTEEQMEQINKYSEMYSKTFTESVRILVDEGLKQILDNGESITLVYDGVAEKIAEMEGEIKKLSWWTCDDNTSRLGNMEVRLEEIQKQLNVVLAASKLFKGHLKDRSIHLQD